MIYSRYGRSFPSIWNLFISRFRSNINVLYSFDVFWWKHIKTFLRRTIKNLNEKADQNPTSQKSVITKGPEKFWFYCLLWYCTILLWYCTPYVEAFTSSAAHDDYLRASTLASALFITMLNFS